MFGYYIPLVLHVVSAILTLVSNNIPDEIHGVAESVDQHEAEALGDKPKLRLVASGDIPKLAAPGTKVKASITALHEGQPASTPDFLPNGAVPGSGLEEAPFAPSSEAGLSSAHIEEPGQGGDNVPSESIEAVSADSLEAVGQNNAQELIFAHNQLGDVFISEKQDPFFDQEFFLFRRPVFSCWYDSKDEAIDGLYRLLLDAGINFASSTTLEVKTCYLGDFAYKKYAFKALVGLYFKETPHHDEELCCSIARQINDVKLPAAIESTQTCIEELEQCRRSQDMEEVRAPFISDTMLLVNALGCVGLLITTVAAMTSGMGIFG